MSHHGSKRPALFAAIFAGLLLVYLSGLLGKRYDLSPEHHGDDQLSHDAPFPSDNDELQLAVEHYASPGGHAAVHSRCGDIKPNLIVSAIDGWALEEQIYMFMNSLEMALSQELLDSRRHKAPCAPPPVHVHVILPPTVETMPPVFHVLTERYSSLRFIHTLPEIKDAGVVLTRFKGWADHLRPLKEKYDRVLSIDLDVVFQRDPFAMPLATQKGEALMFFSEWRGFSIGQCSVHKGWFNGCIDAGTLTQESLDSYATFDRICAGSTYGTAVAMQVYFDTMVEHLSASGWKCNDQALHIHLYYSNILQVKLDRKGVGKLILSSSDDGPLGTIGTTPIVRFNQWGEVLNERGEVQYILHQYKHHGRLSQVMRNKYGWMASPSDANHMIPDVPIMVEETNVNGEHETEHSHHSELKKFRVQNVTPNMCDEEKQLCSCRVESCQFPYDDYAW
jgi:hypothetical protein